MIEPAMEMRRLVGKFAFFFAGVYLLVLFGAGVSTATGAHLPLLTWPLLLLPAAAFAHAVVDGVRLHRTADAAAVAHSWRRCLLYLVIGVVLVVTAPVMIERMTSV
jgi:hypothetical protein